eukprot:CAMPEP_0197036050 /NCGR_PEP_ID=MMETSP1384-20130603/13662_1 /TAXON_ID=29189 /ORGANISM="Ammonia sp." /LENGTH=518 /DNA_ID=CAMNT_0042466177 /DNA_START=101 /DNA_END=1657 /DNA_ORIENTATION=+
MAWGIGANDVANFFGPVVGARSISLKNAMIIAFVFEFIGGFFLGSTVTDTIRKKIANFSEFDGQADLLLLGMFSALIAASLWVYLATKYGLPVSTTQSIVGAIIGFILVSKGSSAVDWDAIVNIIIFWIGTPLMGCAACIILYLPARVYLLSKPNSFAISLKAYPLFVFIVVFIMLTFLLFKGFNRIEALGDWVDANQGFVLLISLAVGVLFALVAYLALIRTGVVLRYAEREVAQTKKTKKTKADIESGIEMNNALKSTSDLASSAGDEEEQEAAAGDTDTAQKEKENSKEKEEEEKVVVAKNKYLGALTSGLEVDVFDNLSKEESDLQKFGTQFDAKTERLFEWLSVLAATFAIFAHGSNDIANAIAPYSAIVNLSQQRASEVIAKKTPIPLYVLFLGAIFMSIGCITYGYNVIKTLGVKMIKMSPSRGYFTQVAAASVIIIASHYGFPASTTHAQVGSTIGVGLIEKYYNKELKWNQVFNWKLLLQVFFGWIGTIVIAATTSALIYSVMAFSPCN